MDSFTRRYSIALAVIAVVLAAWWLLGRDSRVAELNELLREDPQVAGYVYPFRVVAFENGVATMASPRAADVPVLRFLRAAYPELRNRPVDDEAVVAAQERLVSVQARAAGIVQAEPDVASIRWQLDERWYADRGVDLRR